MHDTRSSNPRSQASAASLAGEKSIPTTISRAALVRSLAGRRWVAGGITTTGQGAVRIACSATLAQKEARRPFSRVGPQHQQFGADGAGMANDAVLQAQLNARADVDARRSQRFGLHRNRRLGGGAQVVHHVIQRIGGERQVDDVEKLERKAEQLAELGGFRDDGRRLGRKIR